MRFSVRRRVSDAWFLIALVTALLTGPAAGPDGRARGAEAPSLARPRVRDRGPVRMERAPGARLEFGGVVGERIRSGIDGWLLPAPVANPGLLEMMRRRDRQPPPDLVPWAGEFVGKYLISAIQTLRIARAPRLEARVRGVVDDLLATQAKDGYLGPFPRDQRLLGHWDLWGHYHAILALLLWNEQTGDDRALTAARRAGDLVCRTYLEAGKSLLDAGSPEMNLAVIHGLGVLHRVTGKPLYLRQMEAILDDWEESGDWLRQGLAGVEFYQTPLPRWESLHDLQGLVEMWRITGEERYRVAFDRLWSSILRRDVHNTGGFSSGERAVGHPWSPAPIETCCTVAWMALCVDRLRTSGDPAAADALEVATWNAVCGAQHPSGRWSTYDTPMDGVRRASAHSIVFQARAGTAELNCCSVNAPRGLGVLSEWAVLLASGDPVVNWYGPVRCDLSLGDGTPLRLEVDERETTYPVGNRALVRVRIARPKRFAIAFRVPSWSRRTTIAVAGEEPQEGSPGRYHRIDRVWRGGDTVSLRFDLGLRVEGGARECSGRVSVRRGPLLLAFDPHWSDLDVDSIPPLDALALEGRETSPLPAVPGREDDPLAPWLRVRVPAAGGESVVLCDFASAGCRGTPYRSWLPARGAPPAPALLDEPRRGERVPPGRVLFRWTGGDGSRPGVETRLLVLPAAAPRASSAPPEPPIVDIEVSGDFAIPPREFRAGEAPRDTYRWRVDHVVRGGGRIRGEEREFRVDGSLPARDPRELEALVPDADGLLLAAPLSGTAEPARGRLQDLRGAVAAPGPRGRDRGAMRTDGRHGRIRYRVLAFPTKEYTAAVRVCVTAFPPRRLGQLISAWAGGMDDPLRLCVEGGKLFARMEAAGVSRSTAGVDLETGRWHRIVVVKRGGDLALWVDGERRASVRVPEQPSTGARNIALGANPNFSGDEYLDARFEDLRLWTRALRDEEVAALDADR